MPKKHSFRPGFGPVDPNSSCQIFKKIWLSVTRYHGQPSSCTISGKNNDQILRKRSQNQTDRQTNRQTGVIS